MKNQSITNQSYESENSNPKESNNSLAESIELTKALKEKKMQDKPRKHVYRFHNPNTVEETADFLIRWFVEASYPKLEAAILKKLREQEQENEQEKDCL